MSVRADAIDAWQLRSLASLCCLVPVSPAFAWAATRVGYAEPMDNAVELAGASPEIVQTGVSLLSGYAIPGFGPYAGTFGSALLGTALTSGARTHSEGSWRPGTEANGSGRRRSARRPPIFRGFLCRMGDGCNTDGGDRAQSLSLTPAPAAPAIRPSGSPAAHRSAPGSVPRQCSGRRHPDRQAR